jgi:hypothetical protein
MRKQFFTKWKQVESVLDGVGGTCSALPSALEHVSQRRPKRRESGENYNTTDRDREIKRVQARYCTDHFIHIGRRKFNMSFSVVVAATWIEMSELGVVPHWLEQKDFVMCSVQW